MRRLRSMASDLAGIKAVMDAMGHGGPAGAGMQGKWEATLSQSWNLSRALRPHAVVTCPWLGQLQHLVECVHSQKT